MPTLLVLLLALLVTPSQSFDGPDSRAGDVTPASDYEATLTRILDRAVADDGLVRYDLLRGPLRDDFRSVLKAVEDYDTDRLTTPAQRLAFWMNAYNVQMLQNIIETPEVDHIVDDGYADAFFKTPFRTAGQMVSLDELENVILRRGDGRAALQPLQVAQLDPRIHVGLNCAAVSCPRLRGRAFTAANVDAELDAAMRDFMTSPRHFRVEGETVVVPSLLDWFAADFDLRGPAGDYLLDFMPADRPGAERLRTLLRGTSAAALKQKPAVRYEYLWDVNRAG